MPFCAKCGAKLEDVANFCPKCGTATPTAAVNLGELITGGLKTAAREVDAAFKTAGQEIDKAFDEMRTDLSESRGPFCPKCGERNPQFAEVCFACGRQIPHVA